MKKRIFSVALIISLALTFASCGDDDAAVTQTDSQASAPATSQADTQANTEDATDSKENVDVCGQWLGDVDYARFLNGMFSDSDEQLFESVVIKMKAEFSQDGTYKGEFVEDSFKSAIESIKPTLVNEFTRVYSELASAANISLDAFMNSIGYDSVDSAVDAQLSYDPAQMTVKGKYTMQGNKMFVSLGIDTDPDMSSYAVITASGDTITITEVVEGEDSSFAFIDAIMTPITFTKQ